MVDASEHDTHLVLRRLTNTSRFFKNKVSSEALRVEKTSKTGRTCQGSVADRYCSAETNISSLGPPVKPWALYTISPLVEQILRRIEEEAVEAIELTQELHQSLSKL